MRRGVTGILAVAGLVLAAAAVAAAPDQAPAKGDNIMPARGAPVPTADVVKDAVKDAVKDSVKTLVGGVLPKAVVPGSAPPSSAPAGAPPAGGVAPPGAPSAGPAAAAPSGLNSADPNERLAALRRKILRDSDFVDNDEVNRDPFRSYLRVVAEKPVVQVRKIPAICPDSALEELSLIAVVSGDATPRAMFRDQKGLGYTVKRGDYLSKSGARISKILSDRVIFEITEVQPNGETHAAEKAVLIDPQGTPK